MTPYILLIPDIRAEKQAKERALKEKQAAEEERRRLALEQKRREREEAERKRLEDAQRAQQAQREAAILTPQRQYQSQMSHGYDMTPHGEDKWAKHPSTSDNYNILDLGSSDDTDDDENPRKTIPTWARMRTSAFQSAILRQYKSRQQ